MFSRVAWKRSLPPVAAAAAVIAVVALVVALRPSPPPDATFWVAPTPSAQGPNPTASPSPQAIPQASHVAVRVGQQGATTPAQPCTLQTPAACTADDFMAMIPDFAAPPSPVPVTIPRAGPGLPANFSKIYPISKPVVFITIDDGKHKLDLSRELIQRSGIPVSIFLTTNYSTTPAHVSWFNSVRNGGALVDSHSVSHPHMPTLTLEQQKAEICTSADIIQQQFGRRPPYFRPPYLEWNNDTLLAAAECGMTAIVRGNVGVAGTTMDRVPEAGDIIVLHFKPNKEFAVEFVTALQAVKKSGLTPAVITDWFTVGG